MHSPKPPDPFCQQAQGLRFGYGQPYNRSRIQGRVLYDSTDNDWFGPVQCMLADKRLESSPKMAKTCGACGLVVDDHVQFCEKCGYQFASDATADVRVNSTRRSSFPLRVGLLLVGLAGIE